VVALVVAAGAVIGALGRWLARKLDAAASDADNQRAEMVKLNTAQHGENLRSLNDLHAGQERIHHALGRIEGVVTERLDGMDKRLDGLDERVSRLERPRL
jgi:hypothetical protein